MQVLHGKHIPSGQARMVGYNMFSAASSTQANARTGDIVYSRLMGKDIIIINSEKIAKDLLENRSGNYSDRPHYITTEMSVPCFLFMLLSSTHYPRCGLDFSSVLLPYGDRWRLHRRFFHQTFRLDAVSRFLPLQHHKACHLLRQLFDSPEQLNEHVFE